MATFDLSKVTCVVGAIPLTGGWAPGDDVIGVEQVEPSNEATQGAGGDVMFSASKCKLCKVTLKFLRTSTSNAVLSAILKLQEEGAGGGPLGIKDGANFLISPEAVVEGPPKTSMGRNGGELEWTILAADCDYFLGGYP